MKMRTVKKLQLNRETLCALDQPPIPTDAYFVTTTCRSGRTCCLED